MASLIDYRCMGVGPRWVGLGQIFGGLGWVLVDEMDPRTTLSWRLLHPARCVLGHDVLKIHANIDNPTSALTVRESPNFLRHLGNRGGGTGR